MFHLEPGRSGIVTFQTRREVTNMFQTRLLMVCLVGVVAVACGDDSSGGGGSGGSGGAGGSGGSGAGTTDGGSTSDAGGPATGGGGSTTDGGAPATGGGGSGDGGAATGGAPEGGGGAGPGPGEGMFAEPCAGNEDCASEVCHNFPQQGGMLCTELCESAGDCPEESSGCNGMGYCKPN